MVTNAARHLSLVMGLLMMLLMTAALVAGQAGAPVPASARADAGYRDVSRLNEPRSGTGSASIPAWADDLRVDPALTRRAVEAAAAVVRDFRQAP